jgi:hypothetical protein
VVTPCGKFLPYQWITRAVLRRQKWVQIPAETRVGRLATANVAALPELFILLRQPQMPRSSPMAMCIASTPSANEIMTVCGPSGSTPSRTCGPSRFQVRSQVPAKCGCGWATSEFVDLTCTTTPTVLRAFSLSVNADPRPRSVRGGRSRPDGNVRNGYASDGASRNVGYRAAGSE